MSSAKLPSIKDVAQAAGVSVTTVSRMLNGTLELPAATRNRIEAAIRTLNYQPNPHARRLSLGRSETVGLVVPDIANPFFATLVATVEHEADQRGLAVSLHATLNRQGREETYIDLIARNQVDGMIFITNHPDDGSLATLINRNGKVVIVDEDVPGAAAPKLFCDNLAGGRLAGAHLAEYGHRQVLFVGGPPDMISSQRRHDGLANGLATRFGDDVQIARYAGEYTIDYGREAGRRFLEEGRPASAIFASSDEIAIGMIEVLRSAGVTIPDDVSVVGFDDVSPLHLFSPPLTAVRQPVRELGRRALKVMLDTDWDGKGPAQTEELLPVTLVERDSVAPPAGVWSRNGS